MLRHLTARFSCWLALSAASAFAFSDDGSSLTRALSRRVTLTNWPIRVRASFINGSTNTLRGFCYTEQLPSSLVVTPLSVALNGRILTNFTFESGHDGDIYSGCIPRRWRLESPTNFAEVNPVPPGAVIRFLYSITCATTGTYSLSQYTWAGALANRTNTSFGCSEPADQRNIKFVSSANLPLLSAQYATNRFSLQLDGAPGTIYLLTASSNLVHWIPLATNLSPFSFVETNVAAFPRRFYRAVPYTIISANPTIAPASTNGYQLRVDGVAGCSYILEQSFDLSHWVPIATNVVPFIYLDTNVVGRTACFYRGRLVPPP